MSPLVLKAVLPLFIDLSMATAAADVAPRPYCKARLEQDWPSTPETFLKHPGEPIAKSLT